MEEIREERGLGGNRIGADYSNKRCKRNTGADAH